jgi:hypothetical protein
VCEALAETLRFEQSMPRCDRCGSADMHYGSGDYRTGVTAPDGGSEYRYEEYYQCGRCGGRQSL